VGNFRNTLQRLESKYLTLWSRVLEKLIVTQLVKKFPPPPHLRWNPKFHYPAHKSPPPVPILSHINPFHTFPQSHDSSVGIKLGYGLDDRGSGVRFPAGAGNFSLHHRVQNDSEAHPASYPMGIRGSYPGGKAAGA
jgi:hypothetical protein